MYSRRVDTNEYKDNIVVDWTDIIHHLVIFPLTDNWLLAPRKIQWITRQVGGAGRVHSFTPVTLSLVFGE